MHERAYGSIQDTKQDLSLWVQDVGSFDMGIVSSVRRVRGRHLHTAALNDHQTSKVGVSLEH